MSGPAKTVMMPPMPETSQAYYTMECRKCEIEETCYPTPEPVDAHTKEHNATIHGKDKPAARTVATAEELDALPVRSVILAANGEPFIAHDYDRRDGRRKLWSAGGSTAGAFDSAWFAKPVIGAGLPAVVLHEGAQS